GRAGAPGAESALPEPGDRGGQADRRAGGADRAARGHHHRGASTPRRPGAAMISKTIAELQPGDRAETMRVVEEDDIASFIDAVGDINPLHSDADYAATTPFKSPIAPGIFTAGLISAVIGTRLPGPGTVYLSQSLKFVEPVRAGDTITARVDVLEVLTERNCAPLQNGWVNQ